MVMFLWNKFTYHRQLFLWLLGYSLLLVGCCVVFQYNREKQFKADELNAQLQVVNSFILSELGNGKDVADVSIRDIHPFEELRISIIGGNGAVLYDNSLDSIPYANHLDREEIAEANQNGSGYALRRHSQSTGEWYFYSALKGNGGIIVRTAVPYSVSLHELLRADYGFLWFMGGVAILMCLLGFFATRRLGQHVIRLNKFATDVERGEKISDMQPFPQDELGDISNHIVRLYARLQQAHLERDKEHRIALHEQQEKERIKKQLTNNINHELKTPVASIQVCLETLLAHENLPAEKRKEFLERGIANTERLKQLLADVSLITRMEDGSEQIIRQPVDLKDIIDEVCRESFSAAQAKNISIDNSVTTPLPMSGNESLLVSVFHNLIDNAIAYSGGNKISVRLVSESPSKITLSLSDNGSGVDEEHIPRLFERFYRVDKGRSRAAGGTGLGLSIVKNAVILHGGTISVENQRNGGLLFQMTLSRNVS